MKKVQQIVLEILVAMLLLITGSQNVFPQDILDISVDPGILSQGRTFNGYFAQRLYDGVGYHYMPYIAYTFKNIGADPLVKLGFKQSWDIIVPNGRKTTVESYDVPNFLESGPLVPGQARSGPEMIDNVKPVLKLIDFVGYRKIQLIGIIDWWAIDPLGKRYTGRKNFRVPPTTIQWRDLGTLAIE